MFFLVKRADTVQPSLFFAKVFIVFSCKLLKVTCSQKFAFAQRSGAMKAPMGLLLLRKRELALAGGAGSSCPQQRETERSRRGTPCCTYRYRLWLLAGCVLFRGAPCFCFYGNSCCSICNERVISANAQCSGLIQNPPCKSCTDLAVLRPIGAFPPAQQCIL